jgi:DNA sulfur modification protein DndD
MLLNKLELQNFASYYDSVSISFAETSTIILGRNDTGKSKLFDAFNWVLFERIYLTNSREWITHRPALAQHILNRRALREAAAAGAPEVTTTVELTVESDDGQRLIMTRRYEYQDILEQTPVLTSHRCIVALLADDGQIERLFHDDEAETYIESTIPKRLGRYFLFQGETAAEIMNLGKRETFVDAMNELAKLDVYRNAVQIAEETVGVTEKAYHRAIGKNKKDNDAFNEAKEKLTQLNEKKLSLTEQKKAQSETLTQIMVDIGRLENELEKYEQVSKKIHEKERLQAELASARRENRTLSEHVWGQALVEDWAFGLVREKLPWIFEVYNGLEHIGEVPTPIPMETLRRSIHEKACLLCGHEIEQGSDEHVYVQAKLNRPDYGELTEEIQRYRHAVDEFLPQVETIKKRILQEYEKMEKAQVKMAALVGRIKSMESKMTEFENISDDSKGEIDKTLEKRARAIDAKVRLQQSITDIEERLLVVESESRSVGQRIVQGVSSKDFALEQAQMDLAARLHEAISGLEKRITGTIYGRIQETADQYFKEITAENAANAGSLILDVHNQEIYSVDESGQRILNPNQATRTAILLSFLAGVLEVASNQLGADLPFVADAPISSLDGINKISAISSLVNAFEQSIIILKDDIDDDDESSDPVRQLIHSNGSVGKAYILQREAAPEIADQFTRIQVLK